MGSITFNLSSILVIAFVGTSVAFTCFSMVAIVTKPGRFLLLRGHLACTITLVLWLHFASSIFGGSTAMFKLEVPYHY